MYRPNNVPSDAASIPAFLNQELPNIATAFTSPVPLVKLAISFAEPRFPADGRTVALVYADGTSWDPGSGAGAYVGTTGSWAFLG